MKQKGIDILSLLSAMQDTGFAGGMDIGTEYDDFSLRHEKASPFPWLRLSVGAGPWAVDSTIDIDYQMATLEDIIREHRNKIHALGEIGLDYHWNYGTPEKQKALFVRQLAMATRWNLPVVIHDRDAHDDIMSCLQEQCPAHGGIMHCFSGDVDMAMRALDMGFHISFACNISYKNNGFLREVARIVPMDRLLVETDSPYLAPLSERGKINTPLSVHHACRIVADVKDIPLEDVIAATAKNFTSLIG